MQECYKKWPEVSKGRVRSMDIFTEDVLPKEEKMLQNLFEFYDYEFSQYLDFEVNNEELFGLFGYQQF